MKIKRIQKSIKIQKGLNKLKCLMYGCRCYIFQTLKKKRDFIFKEKKKIDYYIIKNIANINMNTDKDLSKKSRMLKILNAIIKFQKYYNRSKSLNTILSLYDFFQLWQTKIILEKGNILMELDNIQNDNVCIYKIML